MQLQRLTKSHPVLATFPEPPFSTRTCVMLRLVLYVAEVVASPRTSKHSQVELSAEAKERGYFRITPDKGTVSPGATAEVSCAFEPPPPPPRMPGPAGGKGGTLEVICDVTVSD